MAQPLINLLKLNALRSGCHNVDMGKVADLIKGFTIKEFGRYSNEALDEIRRLSATLTFEIGKVIKQ